MSSKLQHQLIGIIIMISVSIIVLPNLLNGKKKHYIDEIVTVPLIPKSDNLENTDRALLTKKPPQECASTVIEGGNNQSKANTELSILQQNHIPEIITPLIKAPRLAEKIKLKSIKQFKSFEQTKSIKQKKGKTYIVQLGALKNAVKVNEITAQLYLSGYLVWTVPEIPVHGQITRIYVNPGKIPKAKIQETISELKSISGLRGIIKFDDVH